jgi:hypothetical protein
MGVRGMKGIMDPQYQRATIMSSPVGTMPLQHEKYQAKPPQDSTQRQMLGSSSPERPPKPLAVSPSILGSRSLAWLLQQGMLELRVALLIEEEVKEEKPMGGSPSRPASPSLPGWGSDTELLPGGGTTYPNPTWVRSECDM